MSSKLVGNQSGRFSVDGNNIYRQKSNFISLDEIDYNNSVCIHQCHPWDLESPLMSGNPIFIHFFFRFPVPNMEISYLE